LNLDWKSPVRNWQAGRGQEIMAEVTIASVNLKLNC